LVHNALPGDVLNLDVQARRRGVLRADIVDVVEASAQRIAPACAVADQCGGCALQCISVAEQAKVKSAWVADAFESLINPDTTWLPAQVHEDRYRRRVRWFVGKADNGAYLGFYAPASHRVVRHVSCPVLAPALNLLRQCIEQDINLEGIDSVQAIALDDGIHVVLEGDHDLSLSSEDFPENLLALQGIPLQWWWRDSRHITRPLKKPVQLFHDALPAGDCDIHLAVGADDFVQGQLEGNQALIRQIQAWAGSVSRIVDLFCGIGNLSLPLAVATGASVFGAELNAASVRAASRNAKALACTASFKVANLFETFDLEAYIGADILILDPPRRGARKVCQQMSRLLPKKIIMISCDPASGARDGLVLKQQGYALKALRAIDLFAAAGHVEAMSLWECCG